MACDSLPSTDLLLYLPTYQVVICTPCQYAIQPAAISGHLKDIHDLYRAQRRPYMQYISQLSLNTPQEVLNSNVVDFPVFPLPVHNGLQCTSEGCGHLCVSENRMKSHWIASHGRPGERPCRDVMNTDWRDVPLQTFFRGNLLRYFTGASQKKPDMVTFVLPALKQNTAQAYVETQLLPDLKAQAPIICASSPTEAFLLNHYTTATCLTISTPSTTTLWRDIVPTLAKTQPFLHYGLLALSSLHLFHSTSSASYALEAAHYQSMAMPLFRHAIAKVNPQNCDAVLVFMHILVLYTFAVEKDKAALFLASDSESPEREGEHEKGGEQETERAEEDPSLPPWLYFLRSGCVLLYSVWEAVDTGLVSEMAASWEIPIPISALESSHTLSLISYFDSLIPSPAIKNTNTTDSSNNSNTWWDEDVINHYKEAALSLASALTIAMFSPSSSSPTEFNPQLFTPWLALRIWPMRLTPSFLSLLSTRSCPHPAALILLAHYCLILRRLDRCWYFDGGARKLLDGILLRLGERWRGCIEWPTGEITR